MDNIHTTLGVVGPCRIYMVIAVSIAIGIFIWIARLPPWAPDYEGLRDHIVMISTREEGIQDTDV